ncbi:MAG TPA: restriction endonuclease subunit S [Terriglobia bacterium]|nr:restriction endonuclease subunit S [Terriglobia bacterium]
MAGDAPISHPKEWPVVRLGDIVLKIGSGATPLGGSENYLAERLRFALIRSQNVFDRRFESSGLAFISDEQAKGLDNVLIQPDDLLLNITGDGITFSRCCRVPSDVLPACVNQHVSIIRVNQEIADPGYVLGFLTHPAVKTYIESFNAGGSRRAITKGHIESFRLPLPPREEQSVIAQILGALDDKLELNRRMNEALEAMARAIFKSWFVDFDPVRAKAEGRDRGLPKPLADLFPDSLDDSEFGKMPATWQIKALGDLIDLVYGKALKEEHRQPGPVAVYGSNGQVGWHNEKLACGPGIIVGRKGNPGVVTWAPTNFFAIDTTFYVVPKTECSSLYFLFYALKDHCLASLGADSAVPGLNRNMAYMSKQLVPSPPVLHAFDLHVRPLFDRIQKSNEQSRSLAGLRDTLLPKLVSGELRVTEAHRFVEAQTR